MLSVAADPSVCVLLQPWGDLAKFAHSWAVICEYGPMWSIPIWYSVAQNAAQTNTSEVDVRQRVLFKVAKTLWKADQPSTGNCHLLHLFLRKHELIVTIQH